MKYIIFFICCFLYSCRFTTTTVEHGDTMKKYFTRKEVKRFKEERKVSNDTVYMYPYKVVLKFPKQDQK